MTVLYGVSLRTVLYHHPCLPVNRDKVKLEAEKFFSMLKTLLEVSGFNIFVLIIFIFCSNYLSNDLLRNRLLPSQPVRGEAKAIDNNLYSMLFISPKYQQLS